MDYATYTTSAEVFAVVRAAHPELVTFSSFSDPSGTWQGGPGERGRMDTEYGFDGAPCPLIGASTTWTIDPEKTHERIGATTRYWLCLPLEDRS